MSFGGFPFLPKALRGSFPQVSVTLDDPTVDGGTLPVTKVQATLHDVRLPLSLALKGRFGNVSAATVDAVGSVSYDALTQTVAKVGPAALHLHYGYAGSDRVRVTGTVDTPVGAVSISGNATVSVADGRLRVRPVVSTFGVPAAVRASVTTLLTVSIRLPALPYGLTATGLVATPDALLLSATGSDVSLLRP